MGQPIYKKFIKSVSVYTIITDFLKELHKFFKSVPIYGTMGLLRHHKALTIQLKLRTKQFSAYQLGTFQRGCENDKRV